MSSQNKFVAKATPNIGWRIWNRKTRQWWGNYFKEYPEEVLVELNGQKRPSILAELCRKSYRPKG